jgi:hypothetical protein
MFGATPSSWLVRGYVAAVERFREQAALKSDSAREVYPSLFEALNWAHSLWDTWFRLVEPQDRHLDGLRYVRNRCHHQLAAAIYPDPAAPGGWRWYGTAHLPPEDVGRGHGREGAKNYSELLEQRPVSRHSRLWRDTSARSSPITSCKQPEAVRRLALGPQAVAIWRKRDTG